LNFIPGGDVLLRVGLIYSLLLTTTCFAIDLDCETQTSCFYYRHGATRLGDHLVTYIKSKWFEYTYGLPLYIYPLPFLEGFKIQELEKFSKTSPIKGKDMCLRSNNISSLSVDEPVNYIIKYNPPIYGLLKTMRSEKKFRAIIKDALTPLNDINLILVPDDIFSIAIHIRTGEGKDLPNLSQQVFDVSKTSSEKVFPHKDKSIKMKYSDTRYQGKFFPLQYFVDSLKYISNYLDNCTLYVYIFTDHPDPIYLVEQIEDQVDLRNIIFDFTKSPDISRKGCLEDLFSMVNFDCLIRSEKSNFSVIAEFIGDHKFTIVPSSYHWERDLADNYYLIVDEVEIRENEEYRTERLINY